jgi:hypothetical protein
VAAVAARNANEAVVAPMVESGGVCVWRVSGVRRSGFCWCVWQESGFSRRVFSHLIYFFKKFDKFCTFNAIFKNNAAVQCDVLLFNTESSFPSTLTGYTTLVIS